MLQNEFSEYAADMNLILAYYHLKDDWQDEKKAGALLGMKALRKKAEKAVKKYPRQSKAIQRELKALARYEKEDSQDLDLSLIHIFQIWQLDWGKCWDLILCRISITHIRQRALRISGADGIFH